MSEVRDLKWLTFTLKGAAIFSTCAKNKYMAVLVDQNGYSIGLGYNGSPKGMVHCIDGGCPRLNNTESTRSDGYMDCVAIHAEANALLHSSHVERKGSTLYVNGTPCFTCAKLIVNSGVARVVFIEDVLYEGWEDTKIFLLNAGISVKGYTLARDV